MDNIDKEVAELLPCPTQAACAAYDAWSKEGHLTKCPGVFRPVVAAWAREREAILQAALATPQPGKEQNLYFQLQGAKAELAALRERLAEAEAESQRWKDDRDYWANCSQELIAENERLIYSLSTCLVFIFFAYILCV